MYETEVAEMRDAIIQGMRMLDDNVCNEIAAFVVRLAKAYEKAGIPQADALRLAASYKTGG